MPSFHRDRIEEHRKSPAVGAPEFVVERQEGAFDFLAGVVEQMHRRDAAVRAIGAENSTYIRNRFPAPHAARVHLRTDRRWLTGCRPRILDW
jgi:hypothetical protein